MLVVTVSTVAVYHFSVARPATIRTVDLTAIIGAIQDKYAQKLTDKNTTEEDHKKMSEEIAGFGTKVQAAVEDISDSCRCIIVVRQAVVNETAGDITAAVKARIGL